MSTNERSEPEITDLTSKKVDQSEAGNVKGGATSKETFYSKLTDTTTTKTKTTLDSADFSK